MVLTEQGFNTEKFVPNPRHSSPLTLRMYEFVGKVIGIALRQQNYLPFELAPIVSGGDEPVDVCGSTNHSTHRNCVQVWKRLLGSKPTLDDLLAIDEYTHKHLAAIKDCEGITSQAEFEAEFCAESPLYFVVNGADGVYVHRAKLRQLVVDSWWLTAHVDCVLRLRLPQPRTRCRGRCGSAGHVRQPPRVRGGGRRLPPPRVRQRMCSHAAWPGGGDSGAGAATVDVA